MKRIISKEEAIEIAEKDIAQRNLQFDRDHQTIVAELRDGRWHVSYYLPAERKTEWPAYQIDEQTGELLTYAPIAGTWIHYGTYASGFPEPINIYRFSATDAEMWFGRWISCYLYSRTSKTSV